jgi:hypothetical protein
MAITKKWSIERLKSLKEDGLVIEAEWRVSSLGEVKPYFLFGSCKFERGDAFVPFEELTETQVIAWVKEKLGVNTVLQLEQAIDNHFSVNDISDELPWTPTVE